MKKVLLISHFPPPAGGIATWTKRVLEIGIPEWGIDHVNLNTIGGRDPFQNTKRHIKDEYIRCKNVWHKEKEFLKNDPEIQVVHTNIPCTVFGMIRETITAKIAKHYKKKFILHCHSTVPNVVNTKFKLLFWKILVRHCDGIITLNEKSKCFAEKYAPKCYVETIPNFVVSEDILNNEKEITDEIKSVVFVGGVCADKGCDDIVEAAKQLPSIRFDLIGIVSKEIEDMEKPNNIVLHGCHDISYVKEALKKADVFLFPSKYFGEGFSVALTEAMAAGLPCVATDWAANADMIEDKGGVVIQKGDVEGLVNAINYLNNNVEFRKNASKWNVEKVKKSYSADIVLKQYSDFYIKITEG